ncbi:hypothetical protein [Cytobacillus gottheilii]|uniref:hypothetical protein n=3 Tax=Cytobacillus gottheilii TaxID=859144 RepID=UPI0015D5AD6E|nr:hypothetical protein [Cytobacillus gottheilii]
MLILLIIISKKERVGDLMMKFEKETVNNYLFSAAVDERSPREEFMVDIAQYSKDLNSATHAYRVNSFDDLIYFFENVDLS